jgi:SAM-dependent methyltransferase
MQDYYEELWEQLPERRELPDFERRRGFLLSEVRVGQGVLDLGCGAGEFTALAAEAGATAVGMEAAEAALKRARAQHPGLDFRRAGIGEPLPLEDNSFDVVWCSEVIEHVADTARWLSEVRRVLVPGGRLLLTTPAHDRLQVALFGIERYSDPLGDHLHLYTRRSLEKLLRDFGFHPVDIRRAGWQAPTLLARAVR